jgi:hypothetical protein
MTTTTRPLETGWLADTPVGDTLLRRFLHNQGDANAALATAAGGVVEHHPDVVLTSYDVPVPYFRQAVLLRPLESAADELLDTIEGFFTGGATLLSAWPTPDLRDRGWQLMGHPTFVAKPAGPVVVAEPPGVTMRVAATADELTLAERLMAEAYPLPEATGLGPNAVFAPPLLTSAFRVRIASLDGTPTAIGASHVAHGVVNLCSAATLPTGRRRGLWRALATARMADAAHLPAVAYTSDFSRPGFERLGYLAITRLTLWWRP